MKVFSIAFSHLWKCTCLHRMLCCQNVLYEETTVTKTISSSFFKLNATYGLKGHVAKSRVIKQYRNRHATTSHRKVMDSQFTCRLSLSRIEIKSFQIDCTWKSPLWSPALKSTLTWHLNKREPSRSPTPIMRLSLLTFYLKYV
jgi:hypothetical protein